MQRYIFLFFISVMCTSCIRCRRRLVSIYPRNDHKLLSIEFLESDPVNHLSSIQKYVCLSILCLCYLPHRNLNSCRWIIYLGKKNDRSVNGEKRNVRKCFSIAYMLHGRNTVILFLFIYFRSFSCPLILSSYCPGLVQPAASPSQSFFEQSVSNTMRILQGSVPEAPHGGCMVAQYIPPVASLQNTGNS